MQLPPQAQQAVAVRTEPSAPAGRGAAPLQQRPAGGMECHGTGQGGKHRVGAERVGQVGQQRRAVGGDPRGVATANSRRGGGQQVAHDQVAGGWRVQSQPEGWQAFAAVAQASVALVVAQLDEIGWLEWCAQLRSQHLRIRGRAVEANRWSTLPKTACRRC